MQGWGHWKKTRGNPPGNLTNEAWEKAFNAADSRLRYRYGWNKDKAATARSSGVTREEAVRQLKEIGGVNGGLDEDFEDIEANH